MERKTEIEVLIKHINYAISKACDQNISLGEIKTAEIICKLSDQLKYYLEEYKSLEEK